MKFHADVGVLLHLVSAEISRVSAVVALLTWVEVAENRRDPRPVPVSNFQVSTVMSPVSEPPMVSVPETENSSVPGMPDR